MGGATQGRRCWEEAESHGAGICVDPTVILAALTQEGEAACGHHTPGGEEGMCDCQEKDVELYYSECTAPSYSVHT